jgi:hypothetical protein
MRDPPAAHEASRRDDPARFPRRRRAPGRARGSGYGWASRGRADRTPDSRPEATVASRSRCRLCRHSTQEGVRHRTFLPASSAKRRAPRRRM